MSKISSIAIPLCNEKREKKVFYVVKKAKKEKKISRGVKATQKAIRKKEKGIVILAGNTSPIDIISHFPALCESEGVPYCFIRDSMKLGEAYGTKAPIICLMILAPEKKEKFKKYYDKLNKTVIGLNEKSLKYLSGK